MVVPGSIGDWMRALAMTGVLAGSAGVLERALRLEVEDRPPVRAGLQSSGGELELGPLLREKALAPWEPDHPVEVLQDEPVFG
jgi:hypothetical protein